jgi:hypothetical protein
MEYIYTWLQYKNHYVFLGHHQKHILLYIFQNMFSMYFIIIWTQHKIYR